MCWNSFEISSYVRASLCSKLMRVVNRTKLSSNPHVNIQLFKCVIFICSVYTCIDYLSDPVYHLTSCQIFHCRCRQFSLLSYVLLATKDLCKHSRPHIKMLHAAMFCFVSNCLLNDWQNNRHNRLSFKKISIRHQTNSALLTYDTLHQLVTCKYFKLQGSECVTLNAFLAGNFQCRVLHRNDKGSENKNIHRHCLRDAIVVPLSAGTEEACHKSC